MSQSSGFFNDGKSGNKQPCTLVLSDDSLLIYLSEDNNKLIIWNTSSIIDCRMSGSALFANYGHPPHQSIECSGDIARQIVEKWNNRHLVKKEEGFVYKGIVSAAIILIVLFFAVGLACYFYLVPWAGKKAAELIPIETEIELGNSLAEVYTRDNTQNDSLNKLVNDFVSQLKVQSPYPIKVGIIVSDEINAFALPGGKIFVYSGIIQKMGSYEELVALLGHEMTHVTNRHSLKSICSSAASGMVISAVFGDASGITSAVISQADEFKQLNYSRELETEADDSGYNFMLQNSVDPKGMLDLLKLLKEEGESMPMMMKYLSTHPDTDARISNITNKPKTPIEFKNDPNLESIFKEIKRKLPKTE